MSLDQSRIYLIAIEKSSSNGFLLAIDVLNGTATSLAELPPEAFPPLFGIAVAPDVEPIPAASQWGLVVLALVLLTGGTILIRGAVRRHRSARNYVSAV